MCQNCIDCIIVCFAWENLAIKHSSHCMKKLMIVLTIFCHEIFLNDKPQIMMVKKNTKKFKNCFIVQKFALFLASKFWSPTSTYHNDVGTWKNMLKWWTLPIWDIFATCGHFLWLYSKKMLKSVTKNKLLIQKYMMVKKCAHKNHFVYNSSFNKLWAPPSQNCVDLIFAISVINWVDKKSTKY